MTPAAPRYFSAASTDQGLVRGNNEDRVWADDARGFFVVIDGMGGHEAGEHAADIALQHIRARLERQTGTVEQRVREAIALANNAIYETAQARPEWKGMACVLTIAAIEDGRVTAGHVGDSRLYRIQRGRIEKITHDHSPVGEREDRGELTEAEAMSHPRRNEVYRDVGSEEHTPDDDEFIEIREFPFEPDMTLLLCSDGLSDAISSKEILAIVERNAGDRDTAVHELISAATKRGKDNVSAILVCGAGLRPAREASGAPRTVAQATKTSGHHSWLWLALGLIVGLLSGIAIQRFLLTKPIIPAPRVLIVAPNSSISTALATARAGDTVSVDSGTYREAVTLRDGIDLIARHPQQAIIEGPVTASGIRQARLEGFQLHGPVRIMNSDVLLSHDTISGSPAAGVEFSGNSRGAIIGCTIERNTGPGIVVADAAMPSIENNAIANNGTQPAALRPGLLVRSQLRPQIEGNVFAGNGAEAIWLSQADPVAAARNYFITPPAPPRRRAPSPVRVIPPDRGSK